MDRVAKLIYVFLLGLTTLFTSTAYARSAPGADQHICTAPNIRTDIRPNADGPATKVKVAILMLDLMEINDISQTLNGDFAVIVEWVDPRLSHLEGCEISLEQIWSPGLVFRNSGRKFTSRPKEVSIGSDGQVTYLQRFTGDFATYHDLRDFPFDEQTFRLSLVSFEMTEKDIQLVVNEKETDRSELLNITDWIIGEVKGTLGREHVKSLGTFHSRYDFNIPAERIKAYYLWKIILPLCLIVAMSWCVFWINPALYGPQIGLSATSMLTLVAFLFATTNMVPELGYLTRLDRFLFGSMILVFLALIQSLTTIYLVSNDQNEIAMRLDKVSRLVFPLIFVIIFIIVLLL